MASTADRSASTLAKERLVRDMLARVADTWTLLVIDALAEHGTLRFGALRERIGGVSQKMLTKTLRQLERDGLVSRRVHPVVPPHVDYALTRLGESLGEALCPVWVWAEKNGRVVERARKAYDALAPVSPNRVLLRPHRYSAQMAWTATVGDYSFVSAPASTSSSIFAEVGHERNGVFFAR